MSESQTPDDLFDRLNKRVVEAVKAHANDPLMGGFVDLPPIDTGVAKLLRCEFYADEGVLKFRAVGGVVAPTMLAGGVPTAGMETTQFAAITESGTADAVADVLQVFRKLVGQTTLDKLVAAYSSSPRGLNQMAQAIAKAAAADPIYFRFSNKFEENSKGRLDPKTAKPYPGRCWQRWQTAIPGYTPPVAATKSAPSPAAPSANGVHKATDEYRNSDGTVKAPKGEGGPAWSERKTAVAPSAPPDTFPLGTETPDVAVLVARAMDGELAAQSELESLAGNLGYTADDVTEAAGWEEIGAWVTSGTPKDGSAATSTATADLPAVGSTVKYLPQDKKYPKDPTKRNSRPVDCEVVSHNAVEGTFTIRSLKDAKTEWVTNPDDPYVTI